MKAKNGISLIVLVITIVVIIILAAAVILSLGNNNPINSSRIATLTQTRDNIESATTMYLSTAFTKTLGEYDAKAVLLNEGVFTIEKEAEDGTKTTVSDEDKVVLLSGKENELTVGEVKYYKIDTKNAKTVLEVDLTKETAGTWYLAPATGRALVAFETYPSYLMDGENLNSSVVDFVATK